MKIRKKTNNKGFTLIELLVVIAIIGFVSSIVLASLSSVRSQARDAKRVGEMRSLEKALALYSLSNNGGYPRSNIVNSSDLNAIKNANGSINCNHANAKKNREDLYDTLIAAKAMSTRPSEDTLNSLGYCYIYITNTLQVLGNSYDEDGNELSSGPLADIITAKSRGGYLATFVENTKTFSGYQAFMGVSFGTNLPTFINLNIDLTTGLKTDVNYIINSGDSY